MDNSKTSDNSMGGSKTGVTKRPLGSPAYPYSRTKMFCFYPFRIEVIKLSLDSSFNISTNNYLPRVRFECTHSLRRLMAPRDPIVDREDLRGIPKQFQFTWNASN